MRKDRMNKIISNMRNHNVESMIITSSDSIFYLLGKWIEPGKRLLALYINTSGETKLFMNELFPVEEGMNVDIILHKDIDDPIKQLSLFIKENEIVGIDKEWPAHFLIKLMNEKPNAKFVNGSRVVDEVRMIKDEEEINLLRKASGINDIAMSHVIKLINENNTEKDISKLIPDIFEKNGCESTSFSPIICYGANGAEPHHKPDNTKLERDKGIIIDMGGKYKGYCSDMTRSFFYGNPCDEYKKIYNLVLTANTEAIKTIKPGVKFSEIDKIARNIIEKGGYGKYFTHRTGHNIGIVCHEYPDVSGINDMYLQVGMVFSIEPGIYIPGKFGVRIEDLVVVTEDGCEILNKYDKNLKTL
ncbi:M24 family metallopeptidase [Alkalithermobacter paradoxus]|uniref:Putative peptidase n=1 Tax=Alkalithermobacter paradoxus TaxID=29349 RepID=A0A1V4I6L0_9FIRM|nr:putative peptidase [[Clostridium] thermoalcaliphilum]